MVFDSPPNAAPGAAWRRSLLRIGRARSAAAAALCAITLSGCDARIEQAVDHADRGCHGTGGHLISSACHHAFERLPKAREQLDRARRVALGGNHDAARRLRDALRALTRRIENQASAGA